jgi:hypothetical protein
LCQKKTYASNIYGENMSIPLAPSITEIIFSLRRKALTSPETMCPRERGSVTVVNQRMGKPIFLRGNPLNLRGKTTRRSHPNILPLLLNADTTNSSLESIRGS